MFITRENDYAVRIVRALSDNSKKSVQCICDIEDIPTPYAYKILKKLEKAGLVRSYRGPKGGYALDSNVNSITLYDIYRAIDGPLYLNECMQPGYVCTRNSMGSPCGVHKGLCEIQKSIADELQKQTMADLLKK